jgi:hypothetical protein
MALSSDLFDIDVPLDPDDLSNQDLYAFERACARSGSAASDDSIFAYATGQNSVGPTFTPEEREDARKFLMECFQRAGMTGVPTNSSEYRPSAQPQRQPSDDWEDADIFDYGVS